MDHSQQNSQDSKPFDINNLFNSLTSNASPTSSSPNYLIKSSAIDEVSNNENMHIIKAAIPFLDYNIQKQLAIMVKFMELRNTINLYKDSDNFNKVEQLNLHHSPNETMLQSVRSVCSEGNKNLVDIILNILNINKLIKNYQTLQTQKKESNDSNKSQLSLPNNVEHKKEPIFNESKTNTQKESSSSSGNNSMLEGLKSMLTPEQRSMFDMLSTMMTTMNNQEKENDGNE
jgi:hypothetical protein